jgi:superfamily II DNA or RNA helicase
MITRNGLLVPGSQELKKNLTVRPVENALGLQAPSFKVWRQTSDSRILIPRYFDGMSKSEPAPKDSRRDPAVSHGIEFIGKLRKETRQIEAFDAGVKAFSEKGGGVLSLPCGFGKTTVSLALSAHLKVRTMIVVHKEFLANQWAEKIKEFCPGASIGRVQGDVFDIEKDFVIALIQTLCLRPEGDGPKMFAKNAFDSIGLVIVDEAHHIGAPAFSQFMFKVCPRFTLGLTATPERKDGLTRILYWFLGPEFFRVERTNQAKTRVFPIHYTCNAFKESPPVTRFGKINMAGMITAVTELEDRNTLIIKTVEDALTLGRRVLVLSDRREHCFELHKKIGSKSGLYVGGMKEADLNESSQKQVVIATFQLAHEGLDIPVLDTVVLATPKSDIKQSIGRIMRETPGKKNDPQIYDIVDHWSVLNSMFRKRCVIYNEGGFEGISPIPSEIIGKGQCLFS